MQIIEIHSSLPADAVHLGCDQEGDQSINTEMKQKASSYTQPRSNWNMLQKDFRSSFSDLEKHLKHFSLLTFSSASVLQFFISVLVLL